ncbi:MAG: hypothetical protein WA871_11700 [Candidatus Acidiferrales bacterium]
MAEIDDLIDKRQVPRGRYGAPNCVKERHRIYDELSTPEKIKGVCFHEVGHLIYLKRVSYLTDSEKSDLKIFGPRILYSEYTRQFQGLAGSVGSVDETSPPETRFKYSEQNISELASVTVAGRVYIRFFLPTHPNLGDMKDIETFEAHHKLAQEELKLASINIPTCSVFLSEAARSICQDLQDIALQVSIRADAEKLERDCYTYRFSPSSS